MEHRRSLPLLDGTGRPLPPRIEQALLHLRPRLLRQFPVLRDEDVLLLEVLEEAGRRVALHEERAGPISKLFGYAWVTLRSVAISKMRLGSTRLLQRTVGSIASQDEVSKIETDTGTPEQIERNILLREALDLLSPDERLLCIWKTAGFSSREIAKHQRSSVAAVDVLFYRAKEKIRKALGLGQSGVKSENAQTATRQTTPSQLKPAKERNETDDAD